MNATNDADGEQWIDEEILEQFRTLDEKPTVPVYYTIPPETADRAIEHARRRYENGSGYDLETLLDDAVHDEIREVAVMHVGEQTLAEYADDELDALEADAAATVE